VATRTHAVRALLNAAVNHSHRAPHHAVIGFQRVWTTLHRIILQPMLNLERTQLSSTVTVAAAAAAPEVQVQ
jgi:hypothetical protein